MTSTLIDNSETLEELAGELTGTGGMSDAPEPGGLVPNDLASDVEAYESHQAARELQPEEADAVHQRKVPLGALQEERRARQHAQQQLAAMAQQSQAMQAQFQQAIAQMQAQQQAAQEAAVPSFAEDPEGYVKVREAQFQRQLEEVRQRGDAAELQARAHQVQAVVAQESARLAPAVVETEKAFVAEHPDYHAAFAMVEADIMRQLQQRHPGASHAELQFAGHVSALQFLNHCQQTGQNPCQVVYQRAAQLGHRPGQRVPNAAPRQASPVTLEQVASMDDAQFDAFFASMKRGSIPGPAF